MRRARFAVVAGAIAVALAAGLAVYLTTRSGTSGGRTSGGAHSPSNSPPHGSFVVTGYGADPTGKRDSTVSIRKAITAAEATSGNTVYFPPGTYMLNDNDGARIDFDMRGPHSVVIQGAGRDATKIVEKVGLGTYPNLSHSKTVFQITPGGADGTTITGLTVDSQTYTAGTTVLDFANNTVISHGTFLGARSNHNYNKGVFDVRVIAVCNKTNGVHRINNTVDDVILNGQGSAGNVDLDISCQWDAKVSNLTDTGNGMALYIDRRVTVDGFNYTPGKAEINPKSYVITGPSDHLSLNNIVTSGNGGYFEASLKNTRITDVAIANEKMTKPGTELVINDADNVTIVNSMIVAIRVSPDFATRSLKVTSSTVGSVVCQPRAGATIAGLIGVKCAG